MNDNDPSVPSELFRGIMVALVPSLILWGLIALAWWELRYG